MMQMVLPLLSLVVTGIIAYLIIAFASSLNTYSGLGGLLDLDWMLYNTPAQVTFFMFIMHIAISVFAISCIVKISNHGIVSLEILFLISLLMLILFHSFKKAENISSL